MKEFIYNEEAGYQVFLEAAKCASYGLPYSFTTNIMNKMEQNAFYLAEKNNIDINEAMIIVSKLYIKQRYIQAMSNTDIFKMNENIN